MSASSFPALRDLPNEIRILAALVMLCLAVGYAHAIASVYVTTKISPKGIEERYRGTEPATEMPSRAVASQPSSVPTDSESVGIGSGSDNETGTQETRGTQPAAELQYPKSLGEMLNIIHTHILTMTFIFALSGLIVTCTNSISPKIRKFIVVEPFVGILVTFAGLWATRYLGPGFSWLVSVSGSVMALAFAAQCLAVILELRATPHTGVR